MPKLNKANASKAEDAAGDWGSRAIIDPGVYLARLDEVEVKDGNKGPYWRWEFTVTDPSAPRIKLWHNTSLSENAIGNLGKTFEGFGVSTDTDTDDMLGMEVWVQVGIRTIQSGAREGERANELQEVLRPVEYDDSDDEAME